MNVSLYTAAAAMNANARWQELITENLAASSVPGFKKQDLTTEAIDAGLAPTTATQGSGPQFSLPRLVATTNFAPGEVRVTGLNTDLAIDGPGFFEVRLGDGTLAYTRDGEFHVDGQGQLVTKQGFAVLGDNGPVQFDLNLGGALPGSLSISPDGDVTQGNETLGRLRIVEFNNPSLLTQMGGGLFLVRQAGLKEEGNPTSTVRQGALEQANTTPVAEMANLLTAMRAFETNQRIIQIQDERMGKLIQELTPA